MTDAASSLVTFWLSGSEFAVDVSDVIELTSVFGMTPVPRTASRLAGVTTWRGRTIPVIDPGALLKLEDGPPDVMKRLLVLARPEPFGVLIDRPGRIVPPSGSTPVEVAGSDSDREGLGRPRLVRADGALVQVLEAERLLGDRWTLVAGESGVPLPETQK